MDKKWYQKTIPIIGLLIFFFPIGLFLMWKYTNWHRGIQWVVTGLFAIFVISGMFGDSNKTASQAEVKQASFESQQVQPTATDKPLQNPTTIPTLIPESEKTYLVTRVIDGDTIEIEGGQHVRYIGIDTPETVDSRKSIQCYGKEASSKNKELVEGKEVKLEKDVSETDKYGRLLRYVYVNDENGFEVPVNLELVLNGYAYAVSYPPDIKYQDLLKEGQKEAVENKRGLWSSCGSNNTNTTSSTSTNQTSQSESCNIKGNISSSGEKIYHVQGCQSYNKTVINTEAGERWFCSEQEALQAGWRKALNC